MKRIIPYAFVAAFVGGFVFLFRPQDSPRETFWMVEGVVFSAGILLVCRLGEWLKNEL